MGHHHRLPNRVRGLELISATANAIQAVPSADAVVCFEIFAGETLQAKIGVSSASPALQGLLWDGPRAGFTLRREKWFDPNVPIFHWISMVLQFQETRCCGIC